MSDVLKVEIRNRFNIESGFPLLLETNVTRLLMHFNSDFSDYSVVGNTVTNTGDVLLSTDVGRKFGSNGVYLDGSTYLSVPDSDDFNFSTNAWTISCWVRPTPTQSYPSIFATQGGWSSGAFCIRHNNSGYVDKFTVHWNPKGDPYLTSTNAFDRRKWHHLEVSSDGTTVRMFVNGALEASAALGGTALDLAYGGTFRIGWSTWDGGPGHYAGNIDEIHVSKGIARHTSAFTPATGEDSADSYTVLLLHLNDNYTDSSSSGHTVSSTAAFSTNITKLGTNSAYFCGKNYLSIADNDALNLSTNAWTLEGWVYPSPTEAYPSFFATQGGWSSGAFCVRFNFSGYSNKFTVHWNPKGDPWLVSNTFSQNAWHHVAVTSDGTTVRLFVNGVLQDSEALGGTALDLAYGGSFRIGRSTWDPNWDGYYTGYVDEVRLLNGSAAYITDFTPSTGEFAP